MRGAAFALALMVSGAAHAAAPATATDDVARAMATQPTSAAAFIERGNMLLERRDRALAAADFTQALALEPQSVPALAGRAMANAGRGERDAARTDINAALAIDPDNATALRARAVLAVSGMDDAGAIAALSQALAAHPDDTQALQERATVALRTGAFQTVVSDCEAYLKLRRDLPAIYRMEFTALLRMGSIDAARAVPAALASSDLGALQADQLAASMYHSLGDTAGVMRAADDIVRLDGSADSYLLRSYYRPRSDAAGRAADIDAAQRLQADHSMILVYRLRMQADTAQYKEVIATIDGFLADGSGRLLPETLALRAVADAKTGDLAAARRDQGAALSAARYADDYNSVCWTLAADLHLLDTALTACNRAVKLAPKSAAIQDSCGMVMLRLGKTGKSIASYDQALQLAPWSASSLYGRGIAKLRSGAAAAGQADIAKAISLDATVADTFAPYDLRP